MKKALGFAVALGLVAGVASSAIAEDALSISGDVRWRGVYKTNHTDGSDDASDKMQKMDQRYRLNANIKVNDSVKINTRLVLADQTFGNNYNAAAAGTVTSDDALVGSPLEHSHTSAADSDDSFTADRFNMTIKMFGGTYIIGRQGASWGNKFLGWGNSPDRLKAVYKNGDLVYGGYLQKSSEGSDAFGDGDKDTFAAFVKGSAGNTKWGVLANYLYDDSISVATGTSTDSGSESGGMIDFSLNTKAGAANIMAELVYKGGDAADNGAGDDYYGGFVGASMAMDAVNLKGLFAFYDGNMGDSSSSRDCDNDFAPTLLIGTCNETAIVDFGGTTDSTNDSSFLLTAGLDFKADDKTTLGATLAYLMATEEAGLSGDNDGTITEIDVWMKYALAQNATYSLGIAVGLNDELFVNGGVVTDDEIFVIGNRIDVKW